jgi:Holliday junction resolvase
MLQKNGYNAVRVPVSNPSLNPLPDIIARRGEHIYAFEVKNVNYYAYVPKRQIDKLFRFLDEFIPISREFKHAVLAAHRERNGYSKRYCGKNGRRGNCLRKSVF